MKIRINPRARLAAHAETTRLLAALDACCTSRAERNERLGQAVLIAQAGGIDDDTLMALLHLAATREMTPSTVRVLRDAGINPDPWSAR